VIANVLAKHSFQVAFVDGNDVIQEVTPAAAHPALRNTVGMSIQLRRMAMLRLDVSE
jgi:hypothetical protein